MNLDHLSQLSAITPDESASQIPSMSSELYHHMGSESMASRDAIYKVRGDILLVEKQDEYLLSRAKKFLKNVYPLWLCCWPYRSMRSSIGPSNQVAKLPISGNHSTKVLIELLVNQGASVRGAVSNSTIPESKAALHRWANMQRSPAKRAHNVVPWTYSRQFHPRTAHKSTRTRSRNSFSSFLYLAMFLFSRPKTSIFNVSSN